jgi:hypothetical protein
MPAPLPNVPAFDTMPKRQQRTLAMGLLAQTRGEYHEALRCYIAAHRREPDDFLCLYFAALVSFQLKRKDVAIRLMIQSLHRNEAHPEAWYNLGKFYQDLGEIQRAAECYIAALEHRPDFGQALVNAGNVFWELGDEETAESCYNGALTTKEGGSEAVYNLSFLLQLRGEWPKAFEAMEARWECAGYYVEYRKPFMEELPRWKGQALQPNQRLLLHGEQGSGDILQMLRYVPEVQRQTNNQLTLGVLDGLVTLCQHSFPDLRVVGTDGDISDCTHQLPSMSLPYRMGTSWDNLPPRCPYLKATPTLAPSKKYRVGLCWAGSKTHPRDKARSMPFAALLPLFAADMEWVNLQVGPNQHDWLELAGIPAPIATAQGTDYLETAGLIASCDLLITVDTSVAHLAGALGVPVWMLVSRFPDVRWMLARADSPWYDSLQIFRQTVAGDWSELIRIVRQLLDYKVQFKDKGL